MKYNKGDKVRVNQFLKDKENYGGLKYHQDQMNFKYITISGSYNNIPNMYHVKETEYLFSYEMLAGIYDEKLIKCDFEINIKLNKNNFIHDGIEYITKRIDDKKVDYIVYDYTEKEFEISITKESYNEAFDKLLNDVTKFALKFKQPK